MQSTAELPLRSADRRFRLIIVLAVAAAVWINAALLLPDVRFSAPMVAVMGFGIGTALMQWRLDAAADYAFLVFMFLTISFVYLLGIDAESLMLFESIALLIATGGLLVMSIPEQRVLKAFAVFAVFVSGYMMARYAELSLENSQTVQVLWFAMVALAGVLTKSLRERRLHARLAHLEAMVMRDALTGLLNQQSAYAEIEALCASADAQQMPMVFAVIDLDGFKEVNDRFGHDVGNVMLSQVAACIRNHVDERHDVASRIGGDEFMVCWFGLQESDARARADALRLSIRQLRLTPEGEGGEVIDASIGLALREPASQDPVATLVRRADQAMYEVKRSHPHKPARNA